MDAHDGADIASKIAAASCDGEVLDRIETISVNHKISIILINSRRLATVSVVEELGERLPLNVVDLVHVEPSAITREHNGMSLGNKMFAGSVLNRLFRLAIGSRVLFTSSIVVLALSLILGRVAHFLVFGASGRLGQRAVRRIQRVV